ncbi:GNAT family N-acetyltransferase [Micromonospora sp. NPDC001898]|uniref:GNAT family N-acetyltransferase n=1 Tax=Micromonospora sp. NPDC001898 TaxID=3364221 RepID=UPI00368DFE5F
MARSTSIEPPARRLTDGTVALRLRRASDLGAIAAASHDPETRRWLDDEPMDEEARRTSLARADEAWRNGRGAPLVIADAVTDEPVGIINLQFRSDDVATVAYNVFPENRGRGIAPMAVQLLAAWALSDLRVKRLILEASDGNTASIRVAEKCHFQYVGTRTETPEDGEQQHTTVVFALEGLNSALG